MQMVRMLRGYGRRRGGLDRERGREVGDVDAA